MRQSGQPYSDLFPKRPRHHEEQPRHKYAAIHIDRPFDNPFFTIPGAYHTLGDYMRTNGLKLVKDNVIPCFETAGECMDVYMACE